MKRLFLLLLPLVFFATLTKAQPPARILFNSSFEAPIIANNNYAFINEGLVPGWDVANVGDPVVEFWRKGAGLGQPGFENVLPQDGEQHIELNANQISDVYLDVCLLNAETVTLVYHHRARGGAATLNTMEIEALNLLPGPGIEITNVSATSAVNTYGIGWAGVGTTNVPAAPTNRFQVTSPTTGWTRYQADLTNTGSSGTCRIIFRGISPISSIGNFIDNVQIGGLNPLTEFSATGYADYETSGGNMPRIIINGRVDPSLPGDPPASVQIRIQNGGTANPAIHPADYSTTGFVTVIIPPGDYNGTAAQGIPIPLGIVNDNDIEPTEDIRLSYVLNSEVGNIRIADADCNVTEVLTTAYFILDDDNPLPVTFTEWKLDDRECGKVELNWTTSQELNSNYFEVQFSEEGKEWKTIAKLTAKGTSNRTNDYSFVHQTNYKSGYYRLNQVDFNGSSSLTHVISSKQDCDKESNYFKFYPNPKSSNQDLTLEFYSTSTSLNYTIIDALGRQISTNTISTASNQFVKQHIQENLSKGLYLIKFWQNDKEVYQTKLIVH